MSLEFVSMDMQLNRCDRIDLAAVCDIWAAVNGMSGWEELSRIALAQQPDTFLL